MTPLELGKKRAEELGLTNCAENVGSYKADNIHKLLGEGVETFGYASKWDWGRYEVCKDRYDQPNHQALLIGIRPIAKESQERALLREILKHMSWSAVNYEMNSVIAKCKALLKESE